MPGQGDVTRDMEILRWRDGAVEKVTDTLAEEKLATFFVEPLGILDIVMTPDELKEFILGHLYAEGVIDGAEGILDITIADRGERFEALVELASPEEGRDRAADAGVAPPRRGLVQTECGAAPAWPSRPLAPISGQLGIEARALVKVPAAVRGLSELFTSTGAYHYAFLLGIDGAPQLGAHDIGRHTAVDKVIGKALLAGRRFGELALYTTGRISSDVAGKCVRVGIPLVASRGAPLTGAVELARSNNLGMVGFLRGGRFNVYAGEDHIVWD